MEREEYQRCERRRKETGTKSNGTHRNQETTSSTRLRDENYQLAVDTASKEKDRALTTKVACIITPETNDRAMNKAIVDVPAQSSFDIPPPRRARLKTRNRARRKV